MSIAKHQISEAFSNKKMSLIIFPTEKCNFRCTYCYERFDVGKMSDKIICSIKNLVKNKTDLNSLDVSWFGGEPMVAKSVVLELSNYFQSHCLDKDIAFTSGMTTNGYFLNIDNLSALLAAGINQFQISFDGDIDVHNTTRRLANGSGTFEEIWNNLVNAKKRTEAFHIILRIHVSADNLDSMPDFLKKLGETFLSDDRFSVNIHPVEALGGNDESTNLLPKAKQSEVLNSLNDIIRPWNPISHDYFDESYICYAAKPNSFAIRANGRLAKCTVALYDDRNDIGYLDTDGTIVIDNEKHRHWLKGWQTGDASLLGCPIGGLSS